MQPQLRRGHGFAASKDPPRMLRPMRELSPASAAPPTMGDPLSVPEQPIGYGTTSDTEPEEPEPMWLKMPPELADFFDLGFVHTHDVCPYVVMRVRDDFEPSAGQVELSGPPFAFAGLARVIVALCESVPCLAGHMNEDAYVDEPREQVS